MEYCYHCMAELRGGKFCIKCGRCNADITVQPHQLPPGTVLEDRYLLGKVLGEGAFGITYIGIHQSMGTKVAIKEYFPTVCANRVSSVSAQVTISSRESSCFIMIRHI